MTIDEFEEFTRGYVIVELLLEFGDDKSPILEGTSESWMPFCSAGPHNEEDLKDAVFEEDWESIFEENGMEIEPGECYYAKVLYKTCRDSDDYRSWIYYEGLEYFVCYSIKDVSIEKIDKTPLLEGDKTNLTFDNLFN
jgi:hypothetical protein